MNLSKLFIPLFFIIFISCGKEDILPNIATGGIYGAAKLAYGAFDDPCKVGISKCDNNNNVGKILSNNAGKTISQNDLNTTPSIIAYKTDITLSVDEELNILLKVHDQDGDDVELSIFIEKPTVVSAKILLNPYQLSIKALTSGKTLIRVYATDDDGHVGESQSITVTIPSTEKEKEADTIIKSKSISFTKDRIRMRTSSFDRIGFTVKGLQSDYTIEIKNETGLVELNASKSATTVDIYSNNKSGVSVVQVIFTDSTGATLRQDLSITVTDTSINPPAGGSTISHTIKDTGACKHTSIWKILSSTYATDERTIGSLNSITFQSLSVNTGYIEFFYRDTVTEIQSRPDDAMDIKVNVTPKLDGSMHTDRGFIIQASKGFFNSGYYYVKIDDDCYRGEFPKNDEVKQQDAYRRVKLVIE